MIWNLLLGTFAALVVLATVWFVYATCVHIHENGRGRFRR